MLLFCGFQSYAPIYRIQGYKTLAREVFSGAGGGGSAGLTGSGATAGLGDGMWSIGYSLTAGVGDDPQRPQLPQLP